METIRRWFRWFIGLFYKKPCVACGGELTGNNWVKIQFGERGVLTDMQICDKCADLMDEVALDDEEIREWRKKRVRVRPLQSSPS